MVANGRRLASAHLPPKNHVNFETPEGFGNRIEKRRRLNYDSKYAMLYRDMVETGAIRLEQKFTISRNAIQDFPEVRLEAC